MSNAQEQQQLPLPAWCLPDPIWRHNGTVKRRRVLPIRHRRHELPQSQQTDEENELCRLIELIFEKCAVKPLKRLVTPVQQPQPQPLSPPPQIRQEQATRADLMAFFRTQDLQLHTTLCPLGVQCHQTGCRHIHTFSELIRPFSQPAVLDFYSWALRRRLSTRPLKLSRNCKKCGQHNSIHVQSLSYCENYTVNRCLKNPEVHVQCTACQQCVVLAVYMFI
jgi:hypothetical protein